jgi:hypothetical protein
MAVMAELAKVIMAAQPRAEQAVTQATEALAEKQHLVRISLVTLGQVVEVEAAALMDIMVVEVEAALVSSEKVPVVPLEQLVLEIFQHRANAELAVQEEHHLLALIHCKVDNMVVVVQLTDKPPVAAL